MENRKLILRMHCFVYYAELNSFFLNLSIKDDCDIAYFINNNNSARSYQFQMILLLNDFIMLIKVGLTASKMINIAKRSLT